MLKTIKKGDANDLVKVAQYLTGYSAIKKATGKFDEAFEEHLSKDVIDDSAWNEIASGLPTCSTSKNNKSPYVCAIQILVGGLTVDGVYGSGTKNAVAAFQSAAGLTVDGICGPKTWKALITGEIATTEKIPSSSGGTGASQTISGSKVINNCVHYLQWDSKWKNVKYSTHTSSQTIGNSGCGPSSMAMIMATFIDKKITPVEMCALAVKAGYRTYDNGTSWGFFEYVYNHYEGFSKFLATPSVSVLKAGLKEGALAVCSMNSNDGNFWTKGGHFITAIGCDGTYIYANDPNNKTVPRKQTESKFQSCLKQAFLFWPEAKTTDSVNKDETVVENPSQATKAEGTKIVDISKWQGSIDFDKLKNDVALVIARASCGSDKDVKFDEYAKAMNDRGIPFGVYCYSYAGDEAKAKDEAKKMVSYASKYSPLFYVMDAEEAKITNDSISAFAKQLKSSGAEKIGCYVAHNRYKSYDYDSVRQLFDFTWIPRYGSNNGTIEGSTKPSYLCDLWQYTSTGKVSGINGNVDMNVITGDGKSLSWFLERKATKAEEPVIEIPSTNQPVIKESTVTISGGNCYVRTASSTSGSIIGVAYSGESFPYAGLTSANGWLFITFNGKNGWVSGKYGKLN